jgi:hypothetical protein
MKTYTITIEVTEPDVSEKKLRWLLEEAGTVTDITEQA